MIRLIRGDCFIKLQKLIDEGVVVDCILTDMPYGITACKWDSVLNLDLLWPLLNKIIKPNGAIILFGSQPFNSILILSNLKNFKHEIVWLKNIPTGMAQSSYAPMKYHELISVFCKNKIIIFNKQMQKREGKGKACYKYAHYCGDNNHVKMKKILKHYDENLVNPSSVVLFNVVPNRKNKLHSTQKPILLLEYLIKTYTKEKETVLDFTMGSGSTGVACKNLKRSFIGIELDKEYYTIAKERIKNTKRV
jgi:site-specific DNA-methyltransferase (adenine-specific)